MSPLFIPTVPALIQAYPPPSSSGTLYTTLITLLGAHQIKSQVPNLTFKALHNVTPVLNSLFPLRLLMLQPNQNRHTQTSVFFHFSIFAWAAVFQGFSHSGYSSPKSAITNYHNLGGLKQQRCILSQSWNSQVQTEGISSVDSDGEFVPCLSPRFQCLQILFVVL